MINFRIIGGDLVGNPQLRSFSFAAYRSDRAADTCDTSDVATFCATLPELAPGTVMHTANTGLADELERDCPDVEVTIAVE